MWELARPAKQGALEIHLQRPHPGRASLNRPYPPPLPPVWAWPRADLSSNPTSARASVSVFRSQPAHLENGGKVHASP